MIKAIVSAMCIILCTHSAYSKEYKVIFSNYWMTNSVIIEKISEIKKGSSIENTEANAQLFENPCFIDEQSVVTSNKTLNIDTLIPIPYVKKVDESFEIVYSEYFEGLQASLEIIEGKDYIICKGPFHFTSLCEREVFEPFPKLDAGKPKVVIGTSRKGVMIPKNGIAIGNYGLMRSPKRKITTLSIMLIRCEEIEPNQSIEAIATTPVD
jgi:hypothetical protein